MATEKNKTILITGANRGIGRKTAELLSKEGHRVYLGARSREKAEEAAAALGCIPVTMDVSSSASVEAAAAVLTADNVKLNVIINNAGITMEGFDEEVARGTIETNLWGAVAVADAFTPLLEVAGSPGQPGGTIVNVSSQMGHLSSLSANLRERFLTSSQDRALLKQLMEDFILSVKNGTHKAEGWPDACYSVSKMGMNLFTRILQREVGNTYIVNSVCPGWVRTDMGGSSAPRSQEQGAGSVMWAAQLEGTKAPRGGFFRDGEKLEW